ncbi:MAG: anti-sigma factor family protein [Planctomycetota bacterium]|jgi:hypothetical protein
MNESFEESDLLALIEDELEPAREQAIRRRLAAHPDIVALIDQLRADRQALRSAGEPVLPHDFLEDLEPILARPILMQSPPGAYRRRHRRQRRGRRLGWLVAAAAVVLLACGGIWAVSIQFRPTVWSGPLARSADPDVTGDRIPVPTPTVQPTPAPDLDGTIHHYQPLQRLLAGASSPTPTPVVGGGGSDVIQLAPFAVVVNASAGPVESAILAAASDGEAPVAVVRNFSYDEARDLQRRWAVARAAEMRRPDREPAVADAGGRGTRRSRDASLEDLARRVREHLRDIARDATGERVTTSGLLAGEPSLAPNYEQQLEFSSRGAAYTVSVPVASLRSVVGRLSSETDGATSLRWLDPETVPGTIEADPGLEAWVTDAPAIREALRALEALPDGTIVLLPVITVDADGR